MRASPTHHRFVPYAFLAPFLAVFGAFTLWPLARSLLLAFRQTFGPGASRFVGLGNFRALWADPLFWKALSNTALYTLGSLLVQLPLALGLALLLETRGRRWRSVYRAVLFSPAMVGVSYAAVIFAVVFQKRTGLMNQALHALSGWNLEFSWLQDHVIAALVVASLWMYVGFNMVFFSAALQNVRRELVEAATMDGAGPWSRFRHVVIPAIRPVAGFVVLLSVTGSLQLFELPYLMLGNSGGPDNRGLTVITYLFQTGFETGDLGYASAIGWALAIVLVACAAAQHLISRGGERREVAR
jgi:ABC-type sugar transport system permease subunit